MRKIFSIIILLTISLIFVSCGEALYEIDQTYDEGVTLKTYQINNSEFEYTYSDDSAYNTTVCLLSTLGTVRYFDGNLYLISPGMVYRYNPQTGNVTSLCDDPMCKHSDQNCPFYGISLSNGGMHIWDNNLYYRQQYHHYYEDELTGEMSSYLVRRYVQYNIENRKISLIEDIKDGVHINSECFTDGYRYYLNSVYDENNNLSFEIRKQDLKSLSSSCIKDVGSLITGVVYADTERIYLSDGVNLYYSPLSDTTEEHIIWTGNAYDSIFDGEHFFRLVIDGDKRTLIRMDKDGNDVVKLSEDNIGYFCITQNNIYYRLNQDVSIGDDENGKSVTVPSSDIYKMSKAGGPAELIFTLPDNMSNYFLSYFLVDGNYLYCSYGCYDEQKRDIYESSNTSPYEFLRVNLLTGDLYYISED